MKSPGLEFLKLYAIDPFNLLAGCNQAKLPHRSAPHFPTEDPLRVKEQMRKNCRSAFVLLLPALLCGCFSHRHDAPFNDGLRLDGETVLLVPFRETTANADLWYGESRRGRNIATSFEIHAAKPEFDGRLVSGERVNEAQKVIRDWTKPRLGDSDLGRIGKSVGARFVVEGIIEEFALKNPRSVGFYDPKAVISYRVLDTEKSKVVHQRKRWRVGRERGSEGQFKVNFEFDDPVTIEVKLLNLIGQRLVEELYGYSD